jgi:hypothetical protein
MFVGHFCPPGSGYGSKDPIKSGSNPDPIWIQIRIYKTETGCSLLPEAGMNVMDAVLE